MIKSFAAAVFASAVAARGDNDGSSYKDAFTYTFKQGPAIEGMEERTNALDVKLNVWNERFDVEDRDPSLDSAKDYQLAMEIELNNKQDAGIFS